MADIRANIQEDNIRVTVSQNVIQANVLAQGPAGADGTGGNWGDIGGTLSDQTDLQSALNAKQDTLTGLTSSVAELNALDGITSTVTELNYTDGVTSSIQTQLDAKSTASKIETLTNKTIDANGTGNSITNLEVADLASGVLDTDLSSVSGSDDTLASAKAIKTALDAKQPLDADLTTIAGLTATTDNMIVSVGSAWASRTPTQVKTTLALNNVDNTSDATQNAASATLTNKTLTAPRFADLGFIADANGNELIVLDTVTSAVNEVTLANAATGTNPTLTASGGDAALGMNFVAKTSGDFTFGSTTANSDTITILPQSGTATATFDGIITTSNLTANRTYTLPDSTGTVILTGSTQTLTNKTLTAPALGGASQLAEGASIALDAALSADGTFSGITIAGTAGATLAFGDLVYLQASDSRWELTDADAAATSGDVMIGMCVLAAASDGSATTILLQGNVRADAAFPALTIGAPAYVGTTAGDIQVAQPSGTDDVIRVVGFALTADELYFNPAQGYITHT